MSPYASALTEVQRLAARGQPPGGPKACFTLLRELAQHIIAHGGQPLHQPRVGDALMVRFAKSGTPAEVGEMWCGGHYVSTLLQGAEKRYLVQCHTPKSLEYITMRVAPDSVRFVQAVAA